MMYRIVLLLLLFPGFVNKSYCQNIDITILREINLNRAKSLDGPFITITNSLKLVTTAVPIGMACAGLIRRDTNMIRSVLVIGASSIIQDLVTKNLKRIVNRPRPYVTYPDLENLVGAGDGSFPSGHASGAFAFATALSLEYPEWYVIVPCYTWASSVAYSRMHLGVHYPSDILMGAAVGAGSAWISHYLNQKLFRKNKIVSW